MKTKKLLTLLATGSVALGAVVPVTTITSCSQVDVYKQLEQSTINEFFNICKIPHSSDKLLYKVPYESNVMKLSNYLVKRCQELTGSQIFQDIYGNIWFDVEANDESLADAPTIALQAHMDMVFTYDPKQYDTAPDPLTTAIDPVLETKDGKRIIHSRNYKTTVGGDNGAGVAAILAIIGNKNLKHGKLRIILTNCEENAMQGALMLVEGHRTTITYKGEEIEIIDATATAPAILHNVKYLLNLDGGLGNELCVSCSGAVGCHYRNIYQPIKPTFENHYQLKVSGFTGGHSGSAPRAFYGNAIKAGNEVLERIGLIELNEISTPGTNVYNRVATDYVVKFTSNSEEDDIKQAIQDVIDEHSDKEGSAYWQDVKAAKFELTKDKFDQVIAHSDARDIINLQDELPYGRDEAKEEQGLKTSSNVGPSTLQLNNGVFQYKTSTYSRSDDDDAVTMYKVSNKKIAGKYGMNFMCDAQFHPWTGDTNRKLFDLTSKALKEVCGYDEIGEERAHGGIEPAAWSWAMKVTEEIDDGACVSVGINVSGEHECSETIDVESIIPCMKVVEKILTGITQLNK